MSVLIIYISYLFPPDQPLFITLIYSLLPFFPPNLHHISLPNGIKLYRYSYNISSMLLAEASS